MDVKIEPISEIKDVLPLLVACCLPVSDISWSNPPQFFGLRSGSDLVAVVGLELFESVGLLRSLAVSPSHRGRGIAHQLVAFAEGGLRFLQNARFRAGFSVICSRRHSSNPTILWSMPGFI